MISTLGSMQRPVALVLALLSAVCVSLLPVSAQTPVYRIPGVPVVEPTVTIVYANPYKFAGVPGGLTVPPAILGIDYFGTETANAVYLVDSATVGKSLSSPYTTGQAYTQIEPRPHAGLVWCFGQGTNASSPFNLAVYTLAAFDATSLALVHSFDLMEPGRLNPPPTLGISDGETWLDPGAYLATNNAGTSVILTSGPQVYIISATTGLSTANFTLPNSDEIAILLPLILIFGHPYISSFLDNEAGYLVAVGPDDSLYFVDDNVSPNGTHLVYHTSNTGNLLGVANLNFTEYGFSSAFSLATDSEGFVYIGCDNAQAFALRLSASLAEVGTFTSPYTATSPLDHFQLSVSWGSTPDQDAFYVQVGLGSSPVCVIDNAGALRSSFSPNQGVGLGQQLVYDVFDDSFVESQSSGAYAAIRVARDFTLLTSYPIPPVIALESADSYEVGFPAVDGTGQVAVLFYGAPSYVAVWDAAGQVTAVIPAGDRSSSYPIGLAFISNTIYVQSATNSSYIDMFSGSGAYLGNLSVPTLGSDELGQIVYVAGQGGSAPSLWVTNAGGSGGLVRAIDLTTGSLTTVFANSSLNVVYFALSPSRSVLYFAGGAEIGSSLAPGISPFIAVVDLSTGLIFAQFDAGLKLTDNPAESAFYQAVAVDAQGDAVVPDENSGFRRFAALSAPSASVLGDPQFVGLRGQSFQVHGIDGAVYSLISEEHTAVNTRFVFLDSGGCPMVDGAPLSNCWSHPGSYMGAISIQVRSAYDGKLHTAVVRAGSATTGFAEVTVDGTPLSIGQAVESGKSFSISRLSSHALHVRTPSFELQLESNDRFINLLQLRSRVPLSQLTSHGLLGQTHSRTLHRSTRVISRERWTTILCLTTTSWPETSPIRASHLSTSDWRRTGNE